LSCCPTWNHKSAHGYHDHNWELFENYRVAAELDGYGGQRKQKNYQAQKN
jgi:hypothetical protein